MEYDCLLLLLDIDFADAGLADFLVLQEIYAMALRLVTDRLRLARAIAFVGVDGVKNLVDLLGCELLVDADFVRIAFL